ncbi:MAG: glycosyltransferase [Candidatus Eremiobacteraeota bacterium]|nr:glycosyltransferase [Candidatus Eremiobacteraeota bacterium]
MTERRTLVVDCQLLQTPSRDRGMGRYSVSLLRAAFGAGLLAGREVAFLCSSNLELPDSVRAMLRELRPDAPVITLPLPVADARGGTRRQHRIARALIDAELQRRHGDSGGVDFLILSLFTFDYCAVFPSSARKLLIHYDLIPLVMWSMYKRQFPADVYFRRFATLVEADDVFAISRSSAHDLAARVGMQRSRVTVIDGAHFEHDEQAAAGATLPPQPFALMPTADLPHKNNELAAEAFGLFNTEQPEPWTLVITSPFSEASRRRLQALCPGAWFTGHVDDAALAAMYREAGLVYVASLNEGLGMPVLEAVATERRVCCSRIPVFDEMSKSAFYFFDPEDATSMRRALQRAQRGDAWETKRRSYRTIAARYTWDRSARRFAARLAKPPESRPEHTGQRWAVLCANPRTGAPSGEVVQYLAAALTERAHLTFFLDSGGSRGEGHASFIEHVMQTHDVEEFTWRGFRRFDEVLYVVDESRFTVEVVKRALALPGRLLLLTPGAGETSDDTRLPRSRRLPIATRELADRIRRDGPGGGLLSLLANSQRLVIAPDDETASRVRSLLVSQVPVMRMRLPSPDPEQRSGDDPALIAGGLVSAFATARSANDRLAGYLRAALWPRRSRIEALIAGASRHG